jgi:plasmid stability protein
MAPKPPAPSDLADKFMLRMPDGMRDRLKDEATRNNRSMNAEIVARLERTISEEDQMKLRELGDQLSKRFGDLSESEILDGIRRIIREEMAPSSKKTEQN